MPDLNAFGLPVPQYANRPEMVCVSCRLVGGGHTEACVARETENRYGATGRIRDEARDYAARRAREDQPKVTSGWPLLDMAKGPVVVCPSCKALVLDMDALMHELSHR